MEFRRRLYVRGSSHETTIPKPLLFALDTRKPHDVRFVYDERSARWYLDFEERTATREERRRTDQEDER